MFKIGSLINPNLAFNLIRKQLEKNTGFKIAEYEIHYNPLKDELFFLIKKERYEFSGKGIQELIKEKLKDFNSKKLNLFYLKALIKKDSNELLIYYIENGEKKYYKHILK